jgi:hypothetical protein
MLYKKNSTTKGSDFIFFKLREVAAKNQAGQKVTCLSLKEILKALFKLYAGKFSVQSNGWNFFIGLERSMMDFW